MPRHLRTMPLLAALICVAACAATTTLTSTWKAPDVQTITPAGQSVAAVFMSRHEAERRAGEEALAADLTNMGARGIPAYTIVPNGPQMSAEDVRAKLKDAGVNAVVVMRVVGKDQRVTYTPGYVASGPYGGFGPYWGYGWGTVYSPGYLQSDTLVSVETLLYGLKSDKLMWASTSRTENPSDIAGLVNEVAYATANAMVKEGLLAAPAK
jgi:hypothetical protein